MSTQPILAGVAGSESALDAVRWAAAEAQELRAPLHLSTTAFRSRPLTTRPRPTLLGRSRPAQ